MACLLLSMEEVELGQEPEGLGEVDNGLEVEEGVLGSKIWEAEYFHRCKQCQG